MGEAEIIRSTNHLIISCTHTDPENLTHILTSLLDELRTGGNEREWIEYKVSYAYPHDIGEYISALANSSTLKNKENEWMIWGVEDGTWLPVCRAFVNP